MDGMEWDGIWNGFKAVSTVRTGQKQRMNCSLVRCKISQFLRSSKSWLVMYRVEHRDLQFYVEQKSGGHTRGDFHGHDGMIA